MIAFFRRIFAPAKCVLVAALAVCPLAAHAQLASSSWPEARMDYGNSGTSTATGGFLLPRWTTSPATGASSAPVVGADGNFYYGDSQGDLRQINPSTGAGNWAIGLGNVGISDFIVGSPAMGPSGVVYVATNAGVLYAVSTGQNGKSPTITGSYETSNPIAMSPVVGPNGIVYIVSGSVLKAVNPATMLPIWQALYAGGQCLPAIAADDSNLYLAGTGEFICLNPTNGQPNWQLELQSPGGIIQKPTGAITLTPNLAIVVGSTGFFGINLSTHEIAWYTDFSTLKGAASSAVSLSPDKTAFYFDTSGFLYSMNVVTGAPNWVSKSPNPTKSSGITAVGSDGTIYDVSDGLSIVADSPLGAPLWWFTSSSTSPAIGISIGPDGAVLASDGAHIQATWGSGFLGLAFNPTSVIGGASTTGTITTEAPVSQDLVFTLTAPSASTEVTFPQPQVTLKAGSTSVTFQAATAVTLAQSTPGIVIDCQYGGALAEFLINPLAISGLQYIPSVVGGTQDQCSVTINASAPSGGVAVVLTSNNSALIPPGGVTIPAGQNTVSFNVPTNYVNTPTKATLTASLGNNITATAAITVTPVALSALTFPNPVIAGGTGDGYVTFNGPVQTLTTVSLKSGDPDLILPSSIPVSQGSSIGAIPYTSKVTTAKTVTVTATYNGQSVNLSVNLAPVSVTTMTITPTSVVGGASLTGEVLLNGNAIGTGFVVSVVAKPSGILKVPSSGTVPAGYSGATFTIQSSGVSTPTKVVVTATGAKGAGTASTTVTVNPPALTGVTVTPGTVAGGASASGVITLAGKAGSSGVKVSLTSSSPTFVTVPATISVPSGASSATFSVKTKTVPSTGTYTITATLGTVTETAQLTVTPPTITGLTLSPTTVAPGKTATGTVKISAAAPVGGMTFTLSSSSGSVTVPGTVTIKAGSTSGTFKASVIAGAAKGSATITAGGSKSATLTIS